jgi:hypothetical protein
VNNALGDEKTVLPAGLMWPAHWLAAATREDQSDAPDNAE